MLDLSIIIVNYNECELLTNCLNSIKKETLGIHYEIIVVDNNTTNCDIEKVQKEFNDVRFILNKENVGFAKANNQGAKVAQGKYLCLLNNDTLLIENTLEKLLSFSKELKGDFIIGCKLLNADLSFQESLFDFDNLLNSFGENFFLYKLFPKSKTLNRFHLNHKNISETIEVDCIKGAFLFLPKSTFEKYNGFDERFFFYAEETDFCFQVKKNGGKNYFYPDTSIIHYGGVATEKMLWFKYKNQSFAKIKFYQKNYFGCEKLFLILFHYLGLFLRVFVYLFFAIVTLKKSRVTKSYLYLKQLFIYPKNIFKT